MTPQPLETLALAAEAGLALDSGGRPENPLDAGRGIVLGLALGSVLWAAALALLVALL